MEKPVTLPGFKWNFSSFYGRKFHSCDDRNLVGGSCGGVAV